MKSNNFTLVELTITFTIMCILVSMVAIAAANATKEVDEAICKSRLSDLGKMSMLFSSDNRNFSLASTYYPTINDRVSFMSILINEGYTKTKDSFICPSMDDDRRFNPHDINSVLGQKLNEGSYIMNTVSTFKGGPKVPKGAQGWASSSLKRLHYTMVKNPANSIYIVDAIERPEEYTSKYHWATDMSSLRSWKETDHASLPTTSGTDKRDVGLHHSGFSFNVLFGDGRVENRSSTEAKEWIVTYD